MSFRGVGARLPGNSIQMGPVCWLSKITRAVWPGFPDGRSFTLQPDPGGATTSGDDVINRNLSFRTFNVLVRGKTMIRTRLAVVLAAAMLSASCGGAALGGSASASAS